MSPHAYGRDRVRRDWLSVSLVLGLLLLAYYLVPLGSLLAAQPPGTVVGMLSDGRIHAAAWTSVVTATATTLVAATFGVPLAYWLARASGPVRTVATASVVLPLVLPPVVSGMVVLSVVAPGTLVGELAAGTGIRLTRSLAGVVLAQTFVASPFLVVTAMAAFGAVDPELEHASRSLGASRLETVWRVTIPIAWPGIAAGMTLTFARAIGEFGATIMLAYYPRTMPVQIWVSYTTLGLDAAYPVAVVLVGISLVALVVLNALGGSPWT